MLAIFGSYRGLSRPIALLILAEFFLQIVNAAYFQIFNYLALGYGYSDGDIAALISYRFVIVMVCSLPLGFWLRGRPLLPLLRSASLVIPMASSLILASLARNIYWGAVVGICLLGAATAVIQVCFIPFIMRNERTSHRSEAIALHFTSWSTTAFVLGIGIYAVNFSLHTKLDEASILWALTFLSLIGGVLFFRVKTEYVPAVKRSPKGLLIGRLPSDWRRLVMVLAPSLIIGVGAGLTIPFINLFFHHVYNMEYDQFSLMTAASTFLVTLASISVPKILRSYGYGVSITLVQSVAVMALILLALTESFAAESWAFFAAIGFFLIRQPLMNMANPVISEFTMDFVGAENQEITSSLNQALWAGSWFFSSQIFKFLRSSGASYQNIFLITALIYVLGVLWYAGLIHYKTRQTRAELQLSSSSI